MLRGFLSGIFWGAIFSVGAFWLASQFGGSVDLLSEPGGVAEDIDATLDSNIDADDAGDMNVSTDSEPADLAGRTAEEISEPAIESSPTASTQSDEAAPSASADAAEISVAPSGNDAAVQIGDAEDAVPNQEPTEIQAAPQADAPLSAQTAPQTTTATATPPETNAAPDAGQAAEPPAEMTATTTAPDAAEPLAEPVADSSPVVDFSAPQEIALPETAVAEAPEPEPEPVAEEAVANATSGNEPVVSAGGSGEGSLLKPVGSLISADDETPAEPVVNEDGDVVYDETTPALIRYAAPYEAVSGGPKMAIILITDADGQIATGTSKLPFPVSYGVDASTDSAAGLMRSIRGNGQEVVAITPIPAEATPADVETNFEVYLGRVNEAVAVMDVAASNFQGGRDVAAQVVAAAKEKGLGIITYPRGLNMALQVAERDGGKAELVFRVFDGQGRDGDAIKRFLDQAAFRAGQQEGVILVGRDEEQTVAALVEWMLGTRASTVSLVPVSAILNKE